MVGEGEADSELALGLNMCRGGFCCCKYVSMEVMVLTCRLGGKNSRRSALGGVETGEKVKVDRGVWTSDV